MGAINRFSKVQPAKFNPLSAAEIMKVPLLKGALEQEQLKIVEDARLSMLNADVAPGDRERVMQEQERLSSNFDGIVSDITTNGVGYKTTDRINGFMKDYNTSMSKTGIVGGAQDFYNNRAMERKSAKQNAIRNNYDMAAYNDMEARYDNQQSSFNEDGKQSYDEYQGFYLPENIDIAKMLEAEVKKLGQYTTAGSDGSSISSNLQNIEAAQQIVLSNFKNKDSYKTLKEYGQYTDEYIAEQLTNKAGVMIDYAKKDALIKQGVTPTVDDETDNGDNETMSTVSVGNLNPGKFDLSAMGKARATADASKDIAAYAKYTDIYTKTYDRFEGLSETKNQNNEIAKVEADLILNSEQRYSDLDEANKAVEDTTTDSSPVYDRSVSHSTNKGIASHKVVTTTDADGIPTYHVVDKSNPITKKYDEAVARKEEAFQAFAGPDSMHSYGKVITINLTPSESGSGKNKNQAAKYKEGVRIASSKANPSQIKNVVIQSKKVGDLTTLGESKGEEYKEYTLLTERLKGLTASQITNIDQQFGSDYNIPSIRITFKAKDFEGKETVTYEATIEQPAYMQNMTGEQLRENKDPFNRSFTSDLAMNGETKGYVREYYNHADTKNIVAGYMRNDFNSSKSIKNVLKSSEQGKRFIKELGGDNLAIQESNNGTFGVTRRFNAKDGTSIELPITIADLFRSNGIAMPEAGAKPRTSEEWVALYTKNMPNKLLVDKFSAYRTYIIEKNSGREVDNKELMEGFLTLTDEIATSSKVEAIDILK